MKATGVVRRIDDLGRIVIPKEIRRSFKINEGDSIEIFVDTDGIVLRKYSLMDNMVELATKLVDSVSKIYQKNVLVTDKEHIIASSKDYSKEYLNQELVPSIKDKIQNRGEYTSNGMDHIVHILDQGENFYLVPVIANSDSIGSVILLDSSIQEEDKNIIRFLASILVKSVEE